MGLRETFGLPPDWTDEQVNTYVADLKARALGNLAGPDGWKGISEGSGVVVFEAFIAAPLRESLNLDFPEFDGEVEMIQFNNYGDDTTRVTVRVKR